MLSLLSLSPAQPMIKRAESKSNFFIVIPQIINALIGGPLVKYAYDNHAIFALMMSGVSFIIAASLVFKVKDVDDVVQS